MPDPEVMNQIIGYVSQYGLLALVILAIIEGSIMAIVGGFLAGSGILVLWQVMVVYFCMDFLISHFYYSVGRGTSSLFIKLRDSFVGNEKRSKSKDTYLWLKARFKEHFVLTYLIARFLPIPYTTTLANITSGTMIKYSRYNMVLNWSIVVQGLLYISLGYLIAQGVLFELTGLRLLGLIVVGIILIGWIIFRYYLKAYFDKLWDNNVNEN